MNELTERDYELFNKFEYYWPGRNIKARFEKAVEKHPDNRLKWAFNGLNYIPRQGLHTIGLDPQIIPSIQAHVRNMKIMARSSNKAVRIMSDVHDLPESLTTDLCHENMSGKDADNKKILKYLVEYRAAEIIFENYPALKLFWDEYEERKSSNSKKTKEFDHNENIYSCSVLLQEYDDILTSQMKEDLNSFIQNSVSDLAEMGKIPLSWEEARADKYSIKPFKVGKWCHIPTMQLAMTG